MIVRCGVGRRVKKCSLQEKARHILMTAASAAASSVLRVTPAPALRPRALVCPLRAVVAGKGSYPLPVEDDERTKRGGAAESAPPSFSRREIDDELSNRWIDLDPAGYYLISVDHDRGVIRAAHFLNVIDKEGRACDPMTGEVIPCDGSYKPAVHKTFSGRTAKELSVKILESEEGEGTVTMLVHANYLGREFQRAEACLVSGDKYVQD